MSLGQLKKISLGLMAILMVISLAACNVGTTSESGSEVIETLIHFGMADKLIAVDKYSAEIDGISKDIPVFDIMAPDAESITALKPDIIFATGMSRAKALYPEVFN